MALLERNPNLIVFSVPELTPGLNYRVRIAKKNSKTGMTHDIDREVNVEAGKVSIEGKTLGCRDSFILFYA